MNQELSTPVPLDFKDRKTGLIIFGILTMCFGGLFALFVPLMLLAQSLPKTANPPHNPQTMVAVVVVYGGLALVLIVLGIGSIRATRWARALLLIFSWSAIIMGVISIFIVGPLMMSSQVTAAMQSARPAGQPALPPEAYKMMMLIPLAVMGFFFIIAPAIWVLFYGSRHVKATCEAHHPVPGWTDRCPLPVLALSAWLAIWALMMLAIPLTKHSVWPFFGTLLSGPAGAVACLVMGVVWAWSAWAVYRLRLYGWWMIFVAMCLLCISNIVTYSKHDISESYRLMGYSEPQVAQMQKINLFQGDRMVWFMLVCIVPWIIYLLWIRKFFRKTAATS